MALRPRRRRSRCSHTQLRILGIESLERREVLANWYAAVDGLATNEGTIDSPWDLQSALLNTSDITGGDTLFLRGGTYYHPDRSGWSSGYGINLQGAPDDPVTVRPYGNERATIDGGVQSQGTPRHVVIRDLEIIVSENLTQPRVTVNPGSDAYRNELNRPFGGVNLTSGYDIKLVNNVIHANAQGVGFWGNVGGDSELYGNIIYDNGWEGPDRKHGHGIYAQNSTSDFKFVEDNVLLGNWSLNMQAYGSTVARVDRFVVSRNVFAKTGASDSGQLLVGGEYPSQTVRVHDNIGHAANLSIGYVDGGNDAIVTGNRVKGDTAFKQWTNLTASDNLDWQSSESYPRLDGTPVPVPQNPLVVVNPNRYDSARANLAILNFPHVANVNVDFSGFLNAGDTFKLLNPTDFYGGPIYTGVYQGSPVEIPLQGQEFASFIVLRGTPVAAPPTFAISAASAHKAEGNSASTSFTFTVTRSGDASQAATVDFDVVGSGPNPADAADFAGGVGPNGRLSFDPGQTSVTLAIPVAGDLQAEADEAFTVKLSDPSAGAQLGTATAQGTILNDDTASAPVLSIAAANATAVEGDSGTTAWTITVTRTGDTSVAVNVNFAVTGSGAHPAAASDFAGGTLPSGTFGFAAGQTSRNLSISVAGDQDAEADESFIVTLSNPTSGAQLGTSTAQGVIVNDDGAPVTKTSLVGTAQQANVNVTATRVTDGTSYKTTTDEQGNYALAVPAGTYVATAVGDSMTSPVVATNLAVTDGPLTVNFDPAQSIPTSADLVGRTDKGQWWVSQMVNGALTTDSWGAWAANVTWSDVHTLDFNGDGLTDVAGRAGNGTWWIAQSLGDRFVMRTVGQWSPKSTWNHVRVGDFNADGCDDIAGCTNNGTWWVAVSDGNTLTNQNWSTWAKLNWSDVIASDFNGDGRDDIAGRAPNGMWWINRSSGDSFSVEKWGQWNRKVKWQHVQASDVDGDNAADIIGQAGGSGMWWVARSLGDQFVTESWGQWEAPVQWVDVRAADVDGDGKRDIVGRNSDTGAWWVARSTGSSYQMGAWGGWSASARWDDVMVADYDGDGDDDILGRVNGNWWAAAAENNSLTNHALGAWSTAVDWVFVSRGLFR